MLRTLCFALAVAGALFWLPGCTDTPSEPYCEDPPTRAEAIPADAVKMTPATDLRPPVIHSGEWDDPVPLPGPVNTAGVEDAPVVSRDGTTLYFFWTPDASVPAEEQVLDCVTGVWISMNRGRGWTEPERALLSDDHALDGPLSEQDGTLWFASFRGGTYGDGDIYTATRTGSSWSWQNAGSELNEDYDVGELYLTAHGDTMVFARDAVYGGSGGYDLWESQRDAGGWSTPVNLGAGVNGSTDDGWPYLSPDGGELWFTSFASDMGYPGPAIYRVTRTERGWGTPEEIVSGYVGDPAMDPEGNLYFTHHYVDAAAEIIETDIFVCYRR
jgi:hypothetical protein